jgi:hypothetical protein
MPRLAAILRLPSPPALSRRTYSVARLPVLQVLSGSHFVADLTLGYGEVVFNYLDMPAQLNSDFARKPKAALNRTALG